MSDKISLKLVGEDGNAFVILGRCKNALDKAGCGDEWESFRKEAQSGDYDHLLSTVMDRFDTC